MVFLLMSVGLSGYFWSFPEFPRYTIDPLPFPVIPGLFRSFSIFPLRPSRLTIHPFHVPVTSGFFLLQPSHLTSVPFDVPVISGLSASSQPSHNCSLYHVPVIDRFDLNFPTLPIRTTSHNRSLSCARHFRIFRISPTFPIRTSRPTICPFHVLFISRFSDFFRICPAATTLTRLLVVLVV